MKSPISINSSIKYQNQMNMYVFSFTMFRGRTQSESCFCIDPDAPYLWKIHFVIRGKTYTYVKEKKNICNEIECPKVLVVSNWNDLFLTIGSKRCSCGVSARFITRHPYDMNSPSKNLSISHICKMMLIRHRNSHAQYLMAYNLCLCFNDENNQ